MDVQNPSVISHILLFCLFSSLVIAGIYDFRSSRIPNWLTGSLVLVGFILHTINRGWDGLSGSVLGLAVGIMCLLFFYIKGGMGAGDVKFLGGIGAIIGPEQVVYVFAITTILGGGYSFFMIGNLFGFRQAWDRCMTLLTTWRVTRKVPVLEKPTEGEPKLRYALVIGLGTVMTQVLTWYEVW